MKKFDSVGMSTITMGGLDTLTKLSGSNPDSILIFGKKVGINNIQYVPLRGHTSDNLIKSGIIDSIVTMEGVFEGGIGAKILFGNQEIAYKNNLFIDKNSTSVISIDLFIDSAIEIADTGIEIINKNSYKNKITLDRTILKNRKMVFDNFHARDFTSIGREKVMKGSIPLKNEIEKIYIDIFQNKEPNIVALHIQERNPIEIKKFLSSNDTLLEFEIKLLRQILFQDYNKIPLIIQLDPVPLAPLSGGLKSLNNIKEVISNTETIKKFVDKINVLRYT